MEPDEILALACLEAWRYKKSSDPHHSDSYTFNRVTLLEFARKLAAAEHGVCANWLRRNANAEKDPTKRAAFIEAHNATLARSNVEFRPTHAASSREVAPATQGYASENKQKEPT